MKKEEILVCVILMVGIFGLVMTGEWEVENEIPVNEVAKLPPQETAPLKAEGPFSDWQKYNYDFVDENVKNILSSMIGVNGKTAFYLPPTGYINVSRGSKFGVAFALNNPNPSGENYFEFDWTVNEGAVENCGVSKKVAQGWIERGWGSEGKIGEGWIDHMTTYFAFPLNIKPCSVKYNFVITKDGVAYDSKSVVFNLV